MEYNTFMETYKLYCKLLSEFISYKSISTDLSYTSEINKTVLWLDKLFRFYKFKTQIWKTKSANPVVFASYSPFSKINKSATTVLIYGHYDVQPADIVDGWKYDPFKLGEDKHRFYGRGVIDNKGQVLVHMSTIFHLIKIGRLNCNVKFMIEGNEETGNNNLSQLMSKNAKILKSDYVLISDGELTNNMPTLETSLRGGFNATLIYKTGKTNLHSGVWGGAVPNAANELTKLLSKIYDFNNAITIEHFNDGLDKLTKNELSNNINLEKQSGSLVKLAGVNKMLIEKGFDFYTATGLRPSIQITGFKSGYIDSGYSNIVPSTAEVRLNIRSAPSQISKNVINALKKFIKKHTPKYVKYDLSINNPHEPVKIDIQNKYLQNVRDILEKVYKQNVNYRNVGGAIPFVADVKTILGVDMVSVPLVNEDCNMHGTDENFDKKYLEKALIFSHELFSL
jgi:acetylornithine deacetylase/succinyl-diaminopimelate desuccinylase-like protein